MMDYRRMVRRLLLGGEDESKATGACENVVQYITVTKCSRCGHEHAQLEHRPFRVPVVMRGAEFTHWAWCPTNEEPMLMRFVD